MSDKDLLEKAQKDYENLEVQPTCGNYACVLAAVFY